MNGELFSATWARDSQEKGAVVASPFCKHVNYKKCLVNIMLYKCTVNLAIYCTHMVECHRHSHTCNMCSHDLIDMSTLTLRLCGHIRQIPPVHVTYLTSNRPHRSFPEGLPKILRSIIRLSLHNLFNLLTSNRPQQVFPRGLPKILRYLNQMLETFVNIYLVLL